MRKKKIEIDKERLIKYLDRERLIGFIWGLVFGVIATLYLILLLI